MAGVIVHFGDFVTRDGGDTVPTDTTWAGGMTSTWHWQPGHTGSIAQVSSYGGRQNPVNFMAAAACPVRQASTRVWPRRINPQQQSRHIDDQSAERWNPALQALPTDI